MDHGLCWHGSRRGILNPSDLETSWSSLLPSIVHGELAGVRAPNMPAQAGVWVARDDAGRPHLIVELPRNVEPLVQRTTKGLEVATRELRIGGRPPATYIDLFCVELAHQKTFTAVACDIANAIVVSPQDPRAAVVRSLERWRSFWAADPNGLSREEALGLFGELWFMLRWMGPVAKTTIESWQGPLGARHDFQLKVASIEAKAATASSHGVVHKISNLDQLGEPETGSLYLFSLQVADDVLAANTLPVLIERIYSDISSDEDAQRIFSERLASARYNPAHAERYTRKFRVVREELYRIDGSFPRLTRSTFPGGLPAGIQDVSYTLDLAACAPWRIASAPSDPHVDFLRQPGP